MSNKVEYTDMLTPKGTLVWPYLTNPNSRFVQEGKFETKINFDSSDPEVEKFFDRMKRIMDNYEEKLKKKITRLTMYKTHEDDENIPEGFYQIAANAAASGVRTNKDGSTAPWSWRCPMFDASGRSMLNMKKTEDGNYAYSNNDPGFNDPNSKKVIVGAGSTAILQIGIGVYRNTQVNAFGWSKKLRAAQILELVEHGQQQGNFNSSGFQVHEEYVKEPVVVSHDYKEQSNGDSDIDDF